MVMSQVCHCSFSTQLNSVLTMSLLHHNYNSCHNCYGCRPPPQSVTVTCHSIFHHLLFHGSILQQSVTASVTAICIFLQELCNFIEVDWSAGSLNLNYKEAKLSAQQVGRETASFIQWLHDQFGLQYKDVHVIGHSLGAQAAGAIGKNIQHPKIGRISGMASSSERDSSLRDAVDEILKFYHRPRSSSARIQSD